MSRDEKIERIVAVLRRHEDHLSDGFKWYLPFDTGGEPEYDDVDTWLRKVASEILDAIELEA